MILVREYFLQSRLSIRFLKVLRWLLHSVFHYKISVLSLTEGARVFARYTNGKYYRGFVESVTSSTVYIRYDDGSSITLPIRDHSAVILDELPCYTDVHAGQRVIAYWPGRTRYYPAKVKSIISRGSDTCYQKDVYNVVFDDGDKRREDFNHIRLIPS